MLLRRAAATTVLCAVALSCASTGAPSRPSETLRLYSRALRESRTADAYALLSREAKSAISYEAFLRMTRENHDEVQALARTLERPSEPPRVTATVTAAGSPALLLVFEGGQWRVDASSIDFYGQSTPERAVASFIRAYENRRFDVLLRFVPDAQKQDLSAQRLEKSWSSEQKEEMERSIQALRAALPTARFEELGNRATMAFGSGGTLELIREHGVWKVEDLK